MDRRASLVLLWLAACGSDPAGIRDIAPEETRVVPTLETEVSVLRVENDVAHIYAENILDLHRAQGFVTAQDRYVQIELTRRFGAGTLSEVLGDLGVEIDATARGQGMRKVADAIWANTSEPVRARFEAYAEGVNAYIEVVKRGQLPLPEEIDIVAGLVPVDRPADAMKPMTGYDVAAVAAVLVSRLGYESTDLVRQEQAEALAALPDGPAKDALIRDVFELVAPVHPIAQVRPGETTRGLSVPRPLVPPLSVEPKMLSRLARRTEAFSRLLGKTDREFGSNAWAVSKGEDGGTILANDGHLSLTVPSLFYQQCLDVEYFGEEDYRVCGLFFPGFPFLAVGTNGKVAWGQTYLDGDVTDFYREQIQLGADGLPEASRFDGEWRPLVRIDETYGERTITRWETFDGRLLVSVEGALAEGEGFFALGDWITPGDDNMDGVVEAVSFDWTAFDVGGAIEAVDGFARSETVGEFQGHTEKLVAYAQNIIASDDQGGILYSGYHRLPCRSGLDFSSGADPTRLLDGTRFGSLRDTSCYIPFEAGPRAVSPASRFVMTANHDPLGNAIDGSLADDANYIGGPWSLGFRAHTIETELVRLVGADDLTIESMATVQGDKRSVLGLRYLPMLAPALDDRDPRFSQVKSRLETWVERGAIASSGVETFYATYDAEQRADAAATMIFNAWIRHFVELVFDEAGSEDALRSNQERTTFRALDRMIMAGESPLFDVVATASTTETAADVMRLAMTAALDDLSGPDGFDTTDMDAWQWGLVHQVRFKPLLEEAGADNPLVGLLSFKFGLTTENLPLAENLDANDPRAALEHFPRDGGWFGVDASNPGVFREAYDYSHGPVMRMVIELNDGEVRGQNVLPGGQSGLIGDEHFADQAALWLGNRTIPLRFFPEEAVEGTVRREIFVNQR